MYTFRHFLFDLSQIIDGQGFGLFIYQGQLDVNYRNKNWSMILRELHNRTGTCLDTKLDFRSPLKPGEITYND